MRVTWRFVRAIVCYGKVLVTTANHMKIHLGHCYFMRGSSQFTIHHLPSANIHYTYRSWVNIVIFIFRFFIRNLRHRCWVNIVGVAGVVAAHISHNTEDQNIYSYIHIFEYLYNCKTWVVAAHISHNTEEENIYLYIHIFESLYNCRTWVVAAHISHNTEDEYIFVEHISQWPWLWWCSYDQNNVAAIAKMIMISNVSDSDWAKCMVIKNMRVMMVMRIFLPGQTEPSPGQGGWGKRCVCRRHLQISSWTIIFICIICKIYIMHLWMASSPVRYAIFQEN